MTSQEVVALGEGGKIVGHAKGCLRRLNLRQPLNHKGAWVTLAIFPVRLALYARVVAYSLR